MRLPNKISNRKFNHYKVKLIDYWSSLHTKKIVMSVLFYVSIVTVESVTGPRFVVLCHTDTLTSIVFLLYVRNGPNAWQVFIFMAKNTKKIDYTKTHLKWERFFFNSYQIIRKHKILNKYTWTELWVSSLTNHIFI